MVNKIYNENCKTGLKKLADKSVDCIVTSPPYFGLRDYGIKEQIGLEDTPELFVAELVEVFSEAKRVLKDEGTLWLNLGDSYAASGGKQVEQTVRGTPVFVNEGQNGGNRSASNNKAWGVKPKDLIGIPWMVAFALRSAGWYLRQDIIWAKPNPMPESVTDRCTKSHEYIFLLSKSAKYYYDAEAIKTDLKDSSYARLAQDLENQSGSNRVPGKTNGTMKAVRFGGNKAEGYGTRIHSGKEWTPKMGGGGNGVKGHSGNYDNVGNLIGGGLANKRSVWTVTTRSFSEAHFATFPQDLIVDMIKAGCPEGGIVLDPFMGAGTTALVARKLNRNYIGFELNPDYIAIAEKRLQKELGMFI